MAPPCDCRLTNTSHLLNPDRQVVLEPLPPAVHAAISAHNQQALQLCVGYVRAYVAGLGGEGGEAEAALPLSGLRLPVVPDRVSAGRGFEVLCLLPQSSRCCLCIISC